MASKYDEVRAAIESPDFSHSRAGDGCWRDVRWIYHRDPTSPSGVRLAAAGDASEVEPLLRQLRDTSPLSPTERY
jgi:hypothetical protein